MRIINLQPNNLLYFKTNKNMKAKDVSIESYINRKPVKRKNGYGLYISPFRDERNPSFKINYDKNLWYDYGTGEGGSVIDLVMKLEQCNFCTACKILENGDFSFHRESLNSSPIQSYSETMIKSITVPHSSGSLMQYCISRGISSNIVGAYLKQIYYVNNNREYYSLGMQNVLEGWEIVGLNHFKMVIGNKAYSIIKGERSNELCIFEGIFDFLSLLMIGDRIVPKTDCVILHSVTTLKQTKDILNQYDVIHSFLDNDEAGKKCYTELLAMTGKSKVVTYDFYQDYKDVNDFLLDKKRTALK